LIGDSSCTTGWEAHHLLRHTPAWRLHPCVPGRLWQSDGKSNTTIRTSVIFLAAAMRELSTLFGADQRPSPAGRCCGKSTFPRLASGRSSRLGSRTRTRPRCFRGHSWWHSLPAPTPRAMIGSGCCVFSHPSLPPGGVELCCCNKTKVIRRNHQMDRGVGT
jgi:hypothetical protein